MQHKSCLGNVATVISVLIGDVCYILSSPQAIGLVRGKTGIFYNCMVLIQRHYSGVGSRLLKTSNS